MTSKAYQTCYIYTDGLFIGKVHRSSNIPSRCKAYVHLDHLVSVRAITSASNVVN